MDHLTCMIGIPTRNREGYLAALLGHILLQERRSVASQFNLTFKVVIIDTAYYDDEVPVQGQVQVMRLVAALEGTGTTVDIVSLGSSLKSETIAVNRILYLAYEAEVDFLYKIDDDHILPHDTMIRLVEDMFFLEGKTDGRVLVSGVTPWMWPAFEGAWDAESMSNDVPPVPLTYLKEDSECPGKLTAVINHFNRWGSQNMEEPVVYTELASAANFMMRPDIRVLWSDTGTRSMYCDAAWFVQLKRLLDYRLYFDVSLNIWHVAAPSGGVRDGEPTLEKPDEEDKMRASFLYQQNKGFEVGNG